MASLLMRQHVARNEAGGLIEGNMEREDILRRMRGLAAKRAEAGCTEAEAMAAADLLARMMDRYGFSNADLSESGKTSVLVKSTWAPPAGKLGSATFVLSAVAEYCDCRVWIEGKVSPSEAGAFFGHEEDTLLALFLMDSFYAAKGSAWDEYRASKGAVLDPTTGRPKAIVSTKERETFEVAMMSRLSARLSAMKAARNARVDEPTGRTGNALVVVKKASVDEGFAQLGMKLRQGRASRKRLRGADAYAAGHSAGDRVNITTGIAA